LSIKTRKGTRRAVAPRTVTEIRLSARDHQALSEGQGRGQADSGQDRVDEPGAAIDRISLVLGVEDTGPIAR